MTEETYITQKDLDQFKQHLVEEINNRFDEFIEDFTEVLKDEPSESEDECQSAPENPARYIICTGGNRYFASEIKPNSIYGVDFYLHEVDKDGKEYNSQGTITSADVVIIDLQPEMTLETFRAIKQNCLDYVIQQAQEAKVREEASKKSVIPPKDVNVMSYS